jgi:hypothetical protein
MKGDIGREMFLICSGQVSIIGDHGQRWATLNKGK